MEWEYTGLTAHIQAAGVDRTRVICWDPHYTPEVLRASPGADWGEEEKDAEFHPL